MGKTKKQNKRLGSESESEILEISDVSYVNSANANAKARARARASSADADRELELPPKRKKKGKNINKENRLNSLNSIQNQNGKIGKAKTSKSKKIKKNEKSKSKSETPVIVKEKEIEIGDSHSHSELTLKNIEKTVKIKIKKKPKAKTIELDVDAVKPKKLVESKLQPWKDREEWKLVGISIHEGRYEFALSELQMWQERMTSMPVVIESTLLVLEAKCYDQRSLQPGGEFSDINSNSLHAMALIRFLSHMGQVAASIFGETTTLATKELTAQVGIPEWIVSLRNDINHGVNIPSTESLRVAGDFMLRWLKENYWKSRDQLRQEESEAAQEAARKLHNAQLKGGNVPIAAALVSAYIAARIYNFREIQFVEDRDITKLLGNRPRRIKVKAALTELRKRIISSLKSMEDATCAAIADIMIPNSHFYLSFQATFNDSGTEGFSLWYQVWVPIINLLERKNKLASVCLELGELLLLSEKDPNANINEELCAQWIDTLLEVMQKSKKVYPKKIGKLFKMVLTVPTTFTRSILERMSSHLGNQVDRKKMAKLEAVASILSGDPDAPKMTKRKNNTIRKRHKGIFTVEDIIKAVESKSPKLSLNSDVGANADAAVSLDPQRSSYSGKTKFAFGAIIES